MASMAVNDDEAMAMQAYINDSHLAIVMEYANGGDLHAYVRRKGRLTEREAR